MAAPSPINEKSDLVTYEIKSNGSALPDTYMIYSIEVEKTVNRISLAEIRVLDGAAASQEWPVSESSHLIPGAVIEILAGYQNNNSTIFKGVVTRQSIRTGNEAGPMLVIEARDKAIAMTIGRQNAVFEKKTDQKIMQAVIGKHAGLSANVGSTSATWPSLVQYYATDWDFLMTRADVNGFVVVTDDGKVSVQPPDKTSSPVLTLTYGDDILAFEGELNALSQQEKAEASAWDAKTQKVISGTASDTVSGPGNLSGKKLAETAAPTTYNLQTAGALASANLTQWAKGAMTRAGYAKLTGTVKFQGSALAKPATFVTLAGLGARFNGDAFLGGVRHEIGDGNWTTEAILGNSPEFFSETTEVTAPPAAGLLPGMQGLQVATVKKIDSDPENAFRVQITMPLADQQSTGVWARLATLYATNGSGTFFFPEVGDEVIVGFLNADPRYPVIVGSVYSAKHKAPETPDADNTKKVILSKQKLKIELDEKDKVLTIATPGNNQIIFSDKDKSVTIKDQNSNSIAMSSSGITIKSPKTITLQATQDVAVKATSKFTAQGSAGVEVKGLKVDVKADTQLSLNGSATAELKGGAQCTVKAAMVMIN